MTKRLLLGLLLFLAIAASAVTAQSGYDLFQKALAVERADGNLRGAIQLYERVVKEYAGDRALVARALMRIAECHEKLGQRDAAKYYERVVREFGDQAESVTLAKARLGALQSAPVAAAAQTTRTLWKGPETDPMGSPSADGRYLSFTDWVTGDLAVRDLVASTSRRLTNTGGWEVSSDFAEYSVVSPDGSQVAYTWFIDQSPKGKCVCLYELRVMSLTGPDAGRPRAVLRSDSSKFWARPAAWMPDGKGLLILRETSSRAYDAAILSLSDSSVRSLKALGGALPERLSVSADGRTVALDVPSTDGLPAHDILLMDTSTGQQSVVVQNLAHDYAPMFTADGRHLLFLSDRTGTNSLWRVPMSGGKPAGDPVLISAVSGNSDLLGVTRSGAAYYSAPGVDTNIYVAQLDSQLRASGKPGLAVERFLNSNTGPALSPDGRSLAYLTRRASSRSGGPSMLMIHSFATNQDRQVPTSVSPGDSVSWFPDGRSVLVAERRADERQFLYHRVDIATGEHELITKTEGIGIPARRPIVSPDGRSIFFAYSIDDGENSRLVRFDMETRKEYELRGLKQPGYITSFQVSPDGSDVALVRSEGTVSIIESVPTTGGSPREILRGSIGGATRFSGLAWSPDKRFVFFVRSSSVVNDESSIWRVPAAGGTAEPVGITFGGVIRFPTVDAANSRVIFAGAVGGQAAIMSVENFLPKQ